MNYHILGDRLIQLQAELHIMAESTEKEKVATLT